VHIYFPIGYNLSENDKDIRSDIKLLFDILREFTDRTDNILQKRNFENFELTSFPINAYLGIIEYYLKYDYYIEKENVFKDARNGKIDWSKTIKQHIPLVQLNGSFVYTTTTVKQTKQNENNLITQINKYCVYECFKKMGWLYTSTMPQRPEVKLNTPLFTNLLSEKLIHTNNDRKKILFRNMIDIIRYVDESPRENQFYFGTNRFEYVWEGLIDKFFGIKDKYQYFPKAEWNLRFGENKDSSALQPDSIMIIDDNIYILDAKYYRYGITANSNNLPNSSSINKQITYGEYVETHMNYDGQSIYNAFIMPFNSDNNKFEIKENIVNIGMARGSWREICKTKRYDNVQGILLDVRYLMRRRLATTDVLAKQLAQSIENGLIKFP
jgi:hypothetical protein